MIGIPTPLSNGNFEFQYQLVVENNRAVDLVDVSLVNDLESQFGFGVFKSVRNLTLVTPPKDASSSVALNTAGWDGTTNSDLIDQSTQGNRLAAGDSFVIGFSVEVDASLVTGEGTTSVSGTAVGSGGVPLIDVSGNQIVASGSLRDTRESKPAPSSSLLIPRIGLSKTTRDAVSKGDNWEVQFTTVWENTGTVALDKVEIFDDVAAMFGGQFAGVTLDSVTAGEGNIGSTPIGNAGFALDNSKSLVTSTGPLEVGDKFEVAFTVTIDPSAEGTAASGLESPATSYGLAVDSSGDPILLSDGAPAITYRVSRNGDDPAGDNQKDNLNGVIVENLPSPVTADVSIKKSITGEPLLLPNGNLAVTYEVVTENTGTVDLADLLLAENFAGQLGSAFKTAGNLILASAPNDTCSCITLDSSWNGTSSASLVEQTASIRLAFGDSFTVQFSVELDAEALGLPRRLEDKVVAGSEAVEEIVETEPVTESHESLSSDLVAIEPEIEAQSLVVEDTQEPSEASSPSHVANISITKAIVAEPVLTDRGNYVVAYQLNVENTGTVDLAELSLLEDLSTQFGRSFVKAGNLSISADPSDPVSRLAVNSASWNGKISTELLDGSATNVLVAGDSFTVQFDVEIKPKRKKSQVLGKAENAQPLNAGHQINNYIGAPGPIYSGTPVREDSSSPAPVTEPMGAGRYSVREGSIFSGV